MGFLFFLYTVFTLLLILRFIGRGRHHTVDYFGTWQDTNTIGEFNLALLVLIAAVMKADGVVRKSELAVVKAFLLRNFGETKALEHLHMLRTILATPINVQPIAVQMGTQMSYSARVQLLHMLFDMAMADGSMSSAERAMLYQLSVWMRIDEADVRSIEAMFHVAAPQLDWAYTVLEIHRDATDDEVKRAYRHMAMKYHPDRVNNLGDDVRQAATEKFRKVSEAYNHIKAERGMP